MVRLVWSPPRGDQNEYTVPGRAERSGTHRAEGALGGGKHAARKLKRAQILLAADAGSCDAEIVRTVRVSLSTVGRTKRRFVEGNLERGAASGRGTEADRQGRSLAGGD